MAMGPQQSPQQCVKVTLRHHEDQAHVLWSHFPVGLHVIGLQSAVPLHTWPHPGSDSAWIHGYRTNPVTNTLLLMPHMRVDWELGANTNTAAAAAATTLINHRLHTRVSRSTHTQKKG